MGHVQRHADCDAGGVILQPRLTIAKQQHNKPRHHVCQRLSTGLDYAARERERERESERERARERERERERESERERARERERVGIRRCERESLDTDGSGWACQTLWLAEQPLRLCMISNLSYRLYVCRTSNLQEFTADRSS